MVSVLDQQPSAQKQMKTSGQLSINVGKSRNADMNCSEPGTLFSIYLLGGTAECLFVCSLWHRVEIQWELLIDCSQSSFCRHPLPINKLDSGNFSRVPSVPLSYKLPCVNLIDKLCPPTLNCVAVTFDSYATSWSRCWYGPGLLSCWRPLLRIIWCSCVAL